MRYVFGDYTLDVERYELRQAGRLVPVEPRVFDLLAYLVQHPERTVLTEELLTQLYPNEFAPVERLTNAVAQARRVLHDTAQMQRYIQTVRRRGYRFCVPVTPQPPGVADLPHPLAPETQEVAAEQASVQATVMASPRPLPLDPPPVPLPEAPMAGAPPSPGPGMTQAERRQLTVLVCRLVGVAEHVAPLGPEELYEVAEAYNRISAEVVRRFDGYVVPQDQGDRLVVYFGYPHVHEDDARRAVHTGLGIVEAIAQLNRRCPRDQGVRLGVRVGIHTGVVVVSARRQNGREALALGNTSTMANQVQGLAVPDTVVMSPTTLRLVERYFDTQALGTYFLEDATETVAVYQILREWPPQSQSGIVGIKGLTPLVGREQELQLLRERWAQVQDGWGQEVLLSGEAGIGKSRLVHALKDHLTGEAYTCIECRASPYYQQSAFYPIVEYVQRRLQLRKDDTPEEKLRKLEAVLGSYGFALAEVVPLFTALLSLPLGDRYTPLTLTPERQKQKTLEALLTWLLRETERQPVCLLMEDLHWVDPSTLEWLSLLIDQISTARVLILLTFRPDFQPPWAMRSHLIHVTLGRLSPRQTEEMIGQVVGNKPLPAEVMQQVVATTDGVPLFVEELTKMVVELGLVKEREEHYELTGPLPSLAIPATLHDSLMARLDRLGAAKQVAQLGAVVGREFAYEVLQAVAPIEEATLQQGLAQLVAAELLYQRGLPPLAQYMFKHALIQETAYQSLVRSTRRLYHRQIAHVLEERFPETAAIQPELVAHHYTEADLSVQAIPYWQLAGQRAIEHSANVEAICHFTTGVELLKTLPETPERTQHALTLYNGLGTALRMTKGQAAPEVEHVYTQAYALCQQAGETSQLAQVLLGLWRLYVIRAQLHTAHEFGEILLRLAQRAHDPALAVLAHYALGATWFYLGALPAARQHLEAGIAGYTPDQRHTLTFRQDPWITCHIYGAWALWLLGYPEQALARVHEALAWAHALSHPYSLANAWCYAACVAQFRRDVPAVHEEATVGLSSEHGSPFWRAVGTSVRGWALAMQGQGEEGLAQICQGIASARATGAALFVPYLCTMLAEVADHLGHTGDGLQALDQAHTLVEQHDERWWEAEIHRLRGVLLQRQTIPQLEEAERCFQHALAIARTQQAKSFELRAATSLARLWQQQGKRQEAHDLLAPVYHWFTEGFDTADLQEAKALLEELGG